MRTLLAYWTVRSCAGLLLLSYGCGGGGNPTPKGNPQAAKTQLYFEDVTSISGVNVTLTSGKEPVSQILEVKGGGLALIDYDQDDDLDLFVPNGATMDDPANGPGCRLYENKGAMRFEDVTAKAGLTFKRWGMGAAVGDVDGNGFDDIYIACYGPNALLMNTGDGRFEERTHEAGVLCDAWSSACAFGDIDDDGDLDMYVASFIDFDTEHLPPPTTNRGEIVFAGPNGLTAQHDFLFENNGDGTFADISESSGCRNVIASYGLGVIILDFDQDGRQDIYVGNDSMRNFFFYNKGGNSFSEQGSLSGAAVNGEGEGQATMGIAIGDVNDDGLADIFTSNFESDTNTLHVSAAGKPFQDRTSQYGLGMVSRTFLGWASMFYDFDHDRDEDLLVFNGHVYPPQTTKNLGAKHKQLPLLFERNGRRFQRVTDPSHGAWLNEPHCDRSAAFGDLDGDGDIDIAVGELNGPVRLLRNDGAPGNWTIIRLCDERDGVHNRHALGSRIEVTQDGDTQRRWIFSGGSFQSACAQYAHFGFDNTDASFNISIVWPDGFEQRVEGLDINQMHTIRRKD